MYLRAFPPAIRPEESFLFYICLPEISWSRNGKEVQDNSVFVFTANMVFAESNLDSLLVNLDQTILQHEIYKDRREARIRELKGKATKTAPNSIAAYQLNDSIYREYKSYMCDSAVLYLTKNIRIARNLRDQEREYKK